MLNTYLTPQELKTLIKEYPDRKPDLIMVLIRHTETPIDELMQISLSEPDFCFDALKQLRTRLPSAGFFSFLRTIADKAADPDSKKRWTDIGVFTAELAAQNSLTEGEAWVLWIVGLRSSADARVVIRFTESARLLAYVLKDQPQLMELASTRLAELKCGAPELVDAATECPEWREYLLPLIGKSDGINSGAVTFLHSHRPALLSSLVIEPAKLSYAALAIMVAYAEDATPYLLEIKTRPEIAEEQPDILSLSFFERVAADFPADLSAFCNLVLYEVGERPTIAAWIFNNPELTSRDAQVAAAETLISSKPRPAKETLREIVIRFPKLIRTLSGRAWVDGYIQQILAPFEGLSDEVLREVDQLYIEQEPLSSEDFIAAAKRRPEMWHLALPRITNAMTKGRDDPRFILFIANCLQELPDRRGDLWSAVTSETLLSTRSLPCLEIFLGATDDIATDATTRIQSRIKSMSIGELVHYHKRGNDALKQLIVPLFSVSLAKPGNRQRSVTNYLKEIGVLKD